MLLGIRLTPLAKLTKIGKKHRSAAIIILAVIPMPNITRKRGANETNEEYVRYLEAFYNDIFGKRKECERVSCCD